MNRSVDQSQPLGATLLGMLRALGCRGPDSAGVALFGQPADGWVLQVKLPEQGDATAAAAATRAAASRADTVRDARVTDAYLRLLVEDGADAARLQAAVESAADGVEVISLGRRLEILKQVGTPDALEATYCIARMSGTHGLGHTRLSTESRVDLSHSQPFWAHGLPDVATVHNGHITNYHKLRRRYEQHGVRFYTENDSEVIGVYLRDQLARGRTFEEALHQSLSDFDGSYSYLAATADSLAFVKDRFGLKPLVVAETDRFVAIATEEIALWYAYVRTSRETEDERPKREDERRNTPDGRAGVEDSRRLDSPACPRVSLITMTDIDCRHLTTRQINSTVREHLAAGRRELMLRNPDARHNLAVAITEPAHIVIDGSVGYYCGGMGAGPTIEIRGSAGWGTAESMMNGTVIVDGNAGNGVAASIRDGTVVVRGDAGARAGVSMKGGRLLIQGDCGYMTGFMMQKGAIVICGDAGEALADSMYEGVVFVGGRIADLGNDAVIEQPTPADEAFLVEQLHRYNLRPPASFKKIVSGRKLWN
ncbi:MAG: hypothetical protein HY000_01175, partial [Planctomycetes bacterium]|nr:hypothetical protein [Planctomycetota bacterium]